MNYVGLFILFLLLSFGCASTKQKTSPCPQILIHGPKLDLSETEVRLICGDPEVRAYKDIPLYQASYMLQGQLQSRGFLKPRFETINGVLNVYTGPRIEVRKVEVTAKDSLAQEFLKTEMEHIYTGESLTPKRLDVIESDSHTMLRERGYPCAKVDSNAIAERGQVDLVVTGLDRFHFGPVKRDIPDSLHVRAFDRFYPFKWDQDFDERLLNLTEKRMLRAGVVGATYFEERCEEQSFSLEQKFILGRPRTVRFGVGVSTEVGPMMRVRWSHERYKEMASLLEASLQASFRSQSLRLFADSFWWPDHPRRSLATEFKITREDQSDYRELSAELRPHLKWTRDFWGRQVIWSAGPSIISGRYETDDDPDAKTFTTGALESGISLTTHDYELYDIHPEGGEVFTFNSDMRHPSLGFVDPLLKLSLSYLRLMPISPWGAGRLIGGVRLNAATTWVGDEVGLDRLPPSVRHYAGGSDDVRGFELNSLPDNNGAGALTKFGSKLELRRTKFMTDSLEAVLFFDSVLFGARSWELQSRLWYSPGFGLRWLSPIGLVQGYYARAYSTQSDGHGDDFLYAGIGGVF